MKSNQKQKVIIYIKDSKAKSMKITQQTQNIRDATNKQIRQLGHKYFSIKSLIEKLQIKRDDLFYIGKELEDEYKNVKTGIHLQNQQKRMKDSLYCWFASNFYSEIVQPDSNLLKRIIDLSNNLKILSTQNNYGNKKKTAITKDVVKNEIIEKENIKEDNLDSMNFQNIRINQEIDDFDNSNYSDKQIMKKEETSSNNLNFNYEDLFNF
ncbi:hypothetical protein M9Y10_001588 [Tritrichomonas musculus]|uniref:Uncharacterized protein n=1 Tax=Tritrichomonas musculus TaxID=1915356 RepID=A0ABR2L7T0_9EUKA